MTLTVARFVMDREHTGEHVKFVSRDDDTHALDRAVVFRLDDWRDMGEPNEVTVTIEPGDLLNPA